MASEFDFEKALQKIVGEKADKLAKALIMAAQTTPFKYWYQDTFEPPAPPTPPAAMQGHWVEPRSGRQLHISHDGIVAVKGESGLENYNWWYYERISKLEHGFLAVSYLPNNIYYARTGTEELRLLAWLMEKGL